MYCQKCGAQIPDDSVFCENCGAKVTEAENKKREPKKNSNPSAKSNKSKWMIPAVVVLIVVLAVIAVLFFKGKLGGDGNEPANQNPAQEIEKAEKKAETIESPTDNKLSEQEPVSEQAISQEKYENKPKVSNQDPVDIVEEEQSETEAPSVQELQVTADKLSTMETANAMDFEWFLDIELFDGSGAGRVISDTEQIIKIAGDQWPLLNGGWKAYMVDTITKPYNPEIERYFNVDIDASETDICATMNWAYIFMPQEGKSYEEKGNDLFEGKWSPSDGTAVTESKYGKVEWDSFYITADSKAEYAIGTFYWISGEIERIALMRVED